jgi:hypothetical protein
MINLPPPREYVPYKPENEIVSMGLNILDIAEWIEVDSNMPAELAERRRLLDERHGDVFATLPAGMAGSREVLSLLIDHLIAQFPQVYRFNGNHITQNVTGEVWNVCDNTLHPLEIAGRLVQDDLCLMSKDPATGKYHLTAACLCFPTRWRLAEKIGQPLDIIHDPVPEYQRKLASPMDRLFEHFKLGKPIWRTNWSILDDPSLFQPARRVRPADLPPLTAENAGDMYWMRIERQTLRRLPVSQDILFTIRIYVQTFTELARKPENAKYLAASLRNFSADMRDYKRLDPVLPAVLAWLDHKAASCV